MKIDGYEFRDDRYYTKKHLWIKKFGKKVVIGLDDFLIQQLGKVTDIELTYIDNEIETDDSIATIYHKGEIKEIFPPFSGTVINVNEDLEEDPEIIVEDPYGKGWLIEMEDFDPEDIFHLLSDDKAEDWFRNEVIKD